MRLLFFIIILIFTGCAQKGFLKEGSMEISSSLLLMEQAELANNSQYKVSYKKIPNGEIPLIDDLPVGAVIPYVIPPGGFKFSDKWEIALGQTIEDPDSPFFQHKIPDLNGSHTPFRVMYIAGTLDVETYGNVFGRNDIPDKGNHSHTGDTAKSSEKTGTKGGTKEVARLIHTHSFETKSAGNHNHGAENRPQTTGIVYLIKIK